MQDKNLLVIEGLTVSYGAVTALREISIGVPAGQVTTILGANGAGKTTLLRTISGLVRPDKGSITFAGETITGRSPVDIAKLGIAHVMEGRQLFRDMTVAENLEAAAMIVRGGQGKQQIEHAYSLFPILHKRQGQAAGTLSGGEQQQLAIARALISEPRLLMLDEMSFGLAPSMVDELFSILAKIVATGVTVILVEQFVAKAMAASQYAVLLEHGEVVEQGDPKVVGAQLENSYLGTRREAVAEATDPPAREHLTVAVPAWLARELQSQADEEEVTVELLASAVLNRSRKETRT